MRLKIIFESTGDELIDKAEKIIDDVFRAMKWESWTNWGYGQITPDQQMDIEIYGGRIEPSDGGVSGFHDEDEFDASSSVGCEITIDFTKHEVSIQPLETSAPTTIFKLSDINGIANQAKQYFIAQH